MMYNLTFKLNQELTGLSLINSYDKVNNHLTLVNNILKIHKKYKSAFTQMVNFNGKNGTGKCLSFQHTLLL